MNGCGFIFFLKFSFKNVTKLILIVNFKGTYFRAYGC